MTRHAAITKALGVHPVIAVDAADDAARLALTVLPNASGDLAATPLAAGHVVNQGGRLFILRQLPASTASNWAELITNPASQAYVDSVAQGLDVKASVRTVSLTNITLSGLQTVSGVALQNGDRVLVAGQSTGSQNGLYVAGSGAWVRATDADSNVKVTSGLYTLVTEGAQAGYGYVLTTPDPIVLGTTALTYSLFSGAGLATQVTANTAAIATKADAAATTSALAGKADAAATTSALAGKADAAATTSALALKADTTALTAGLALKLDRLVASVVYTDLARTFQLSDIEKNIGINTATDSQYTVPPGVFAVGQVLFGIQLGVGRIQFIQGAGVTITGASLFTRAQTAAWALYQRAANVWELTGDLV